MTSAEKIQILKDYVEHSAVIYQRRVEPTLKLLAFRTAEGRYDRFDSIDDFLVIAELGARSYSKESGVDWRATFTRDILVGVAQLWKDEFEREYPRGTYNFLLPAARRT